MVTDTMDRVREVSRRTIAPAAADYDQLGTFPEVSVEALADAGLLGLTVPAELGGLGLCPTSFVAAVEEIAAACPSTGMIFVMHVCGTEVVKQSSLPSRDAVLSAIARGEQSSRYTKGKCGSMTCAKSMWPGASC